MAEDNQFFHCSHTVKMAPIEVPEVDMFDKTIRLVNKLNVTNDAVKGYANDTGKFFNNIHEGSNGINFATTEVITFGILFLLILVVGLSAIGTGCYCGGKKITKWLKKKRGNNEIEMKNIPQDSVSHNAEYIPRGPSYII